MPSASRSTPTCTWSAFPPGRDSEATVRQFGANSCDLNALADWLQQCRINSVALESTGVSGIPLFELLEARSFEVYLVEPGQLSHCGARPKTDVLDVQWIQRLHTYGLLRGSFGSGERGSFTPRRKDPAGERPTRTSPAL